MTIKRYGLDVDKFGEWTMELAEDGIYVAYADHERETAELREQLEDETRNADVMEKAIHGEGGWIEMNIALRKRAERAENICQKRGSMNTVRDIRDALSDPTVIGRGGMWLTLDEVAKLLEEVGHSRLPEVDEDEHRPKQPQEEPPPRITTPHKTWNPQYAADKQTAVLRSDLEKARKALEEYGQHDGGCWLMRPTNSNSAARSCTCGFSESLTPSSPSSEVNDGAGAARKDK